MGVMLVQRGVDRDPDTLGIAQRVVVPEAQHAIAFIFQNARPFGIDLLAMLPAVDLDDQAMTVTGEVSDVMADWHLTTKAGVGEAFTKQSPNRSLGARHVTS